MSGICYLCGNILEKADRTKDHVPPKQFFPGEFVERDLTKNLFTLPAHKKCNKSYEKDEQYFKFSLAGEVANTFAGRALLKDVKRSSKYPQGKRLIRRILKEYRHVTDAGILPPPGKVFKRVESFRLERIVWKIARGLFYKEYKRFLPEDRLICCAVIPSNCKPPDILELAIQTESKGGKNQGVFDYKFFHAEDKDDEGPLNFYMYAMLFWDKIIAFAGFDDPSLPPSNSEQLQQDFEQLK